MAYEINKDAFMADYHALVKEKEAIAVAVDNFFKPMHAQAMQPNSVITVEHLQKAKEMLLVEKNVAVDEKLAFYAKYLVEVQEEVAGETAETVEA